MQTTSPRAVHSAPPPATSNSRLSEELTAHASPREKAVVDPERASIEEMTEAPIEPVKTAPPRRMSTRLQLTVRDRLYSWRNQRVLSRSAPQEGDVGDVCEQDEQDSDEDDASSKSSERGTALPRAPDTGTPAREVKDELIAVVGGVRLLYYLLSVPLRIGLFLDPYFTAKHNEWTKALTVFICLDVLSDSSGVWEWMHRRSTATTSTKSKEVFADNAVDGDTDPEQAERHDTDARPSSASNRLIEVFDIIAIVPIEIVLLASEQFNALHLVRFTKLFALHPVPTMIAAFVTKSRPGHEPWRVMRRVLGRLLISLIGLGAVWVHWAALIYILIAHVECGVDLDKTNGCVSWANDDQLAPVSEGGGGGAKFRVYTRAMYWSSRTIITLGFSDVVANSSRSVETFFTILAEFGGAFWCACVIAAFAYWFTLEHRSGSKYSHDTFVHRVDVWLQRLADRDDKYNGKESSENDNNVRGVPDFLRRQIVEYLHHQFARTHSFGEPQLYDLVRQEQLQQGVQCELKTARIVRLPWCSSQSLGFLNALAGEMTLLTLAPLDWVIEFPATQSLFFVVVSGSIAIVSPTHQHQKVGSCGVGDGFGAVSLFLPGVLKEQAFAEEHSEVLVLSADAYDRVLRGYYSTRQSVGAEQREEMRRAAEVEYDVTSSRYTRQMERRSSAGDNVVIPYRAELQTKLEFEPQRPQHATSAFRLRWEAVRCVALVFLTFEVPYVVFFYYGGDAASSFAHWRFTVTFVCSVVVEIFFYADLWLRCRWFEPRKRVNSVTFYLDAIANLPLAIAVDLVDGCLTGPFSSSWRWLTLLRLLRLLRVRRLKKRIIATMPRATGIVQFIIYCGLSILVYCHGVACLWFLVGHRTHDSVPTTVPSKPECLRMAQQYGNCSWTVMDNMEQEYANGDRRFVFLRSLYFSISTFTTVAYGDILPYTNTETWVAAMATYVGGILCYAMFGAMGAAIARLARVRRETRYENHLRARVLEMNRVCRQIRSEVNRFQSFRAKTLSDHELEYDVMRYVTPGLRHELCVCLHHHEAYQFSFLQSADPAFRRALAARMTRRYYFKGDVIFTAGEVAQAAMVIRRGRVELVDGESGHSVTMLTDGATLGEKSFVTQSETILFDYVAETVTEVSVLTLAALQDVWIHFPAEKQRLQDDSEVDHEPTRKYVAMSSMSGSDAAATLARILVRQDSRGAVGSKEFEDRVSWQRAINGSTFRSRWELLVGTVVVYNTFSIIARVAFAPDPSTRAMVALTSVDYVFDLVLLVDIYFKMFQFLAPTELLSVSTRVYTAKQIRGYYRRDGWMWWDLVASLPTYYIGSNYALMTYCRVPRLLRALQLVEIGERVHAGLLHRWTASTSSAGVAYSLLGLGKVLVVLLLCCHVGGSVFYAVASNESPDSGRAAWITTDVVVTQYVGDSAVAYLRSFYWAISAFTVVNYGDIVATTVRETLWTCLICLCGTFFMSKVISDVVDLVQSLDGAASQHRERVEKFEYLAQRRHLTPELTVRGQAFLHYQHEVSHGLPSHEEIFKPLPRDLQAQVYDDMFGSLLRAVPLFETLTDAQVRELAAAPWTTELFLPRDVIVYENALADALYVLRTGHAEIVRFASDLVITRIQSGQLFGEAMFFSTGDTDSPRRLVSVRALSYCEVLRLDRSAWLRFLQRRASNREAGARILQLALDEQLKSRAVLQTLESYSENNDSSSDDARHAGDHHRDSSGSEDTFPQDVPAMVNSVLPRDSRVRSMPPTVASNETRSRTVQRAGSVPAIIYSAALRRMSDLVARRGERRTSDAYVECVTPPLSQPSTPPLQHELPRRAVSHLNIQQRFGVHHLSLSNRSIQDQPEQPMEAAPPSRPVRFLDTSDFCYRWDAVKFFAILYYVAALPLRVAFYNDIERAAGDNGSDAMTVWIVLEYVVVDGFLWLDILARLFLFTPTVRGEPLTSGSERRKWYMQHGSFIIDIFGSFPFELLTLLPVASFHDGDERSQIVLAAFRLTTLVRCFQLEPLWWRLERQLLWFHKDTLTTLKIAFIGVLSSHWVACLWYFVGQASMQGSTLSWLTAPNMLQPSATVLTEEQVKNVAMIDKYLRSYHYAIGSISTTTYGDICSRNVDETFAQFVVTFLCIVFYGYVTAGVRQILARKFDRTIALEQADAKIYRFARNYNLSKSLRSAIRLHLRERWLQESDVDQEAIKELVHAPLRRSIASYLRRPLFQDDVFKEIPPIVVDTLLAELREEAYIAGEIVYEQYAVGRSMYFIESGVVELSTVGRDGSFKVEKQQGEYFGQAVVVARATNGSERSETATAKTACRLLVLDLEAYERVVSQFPTHAAAIHDAWAPPAATIAV